jgi:hypothetical protein
MSLHWPFPAAGKHAYLVGNSQHWGCRAEVDNDPESTVIVHGSSTIEVTVLSVALYWVVPNH